MGERELDGRLQVAKLAAAIEALALEAVGIDRLFRHQPGDAVGQLDLAACAAADLRQVIEDARRQHIAAHDREVRRRNGRLRLLDDAADPADLRTLRVDFDDAVFVGIGMRHFLDAEHAGAARLEHVSHLLEAARRALDQVVGQVHEAGFGADRRTCAQHGVAKAQRCRLADVDA
jgi:hypothetical protein